MQDFDGGLKMALNRLGESNPEDMAKSVWDLFSSISTMSPEQVMASFQSLVALSEHYGILEQPFILRLLDAMRIRMVVIHSANSSEKRTSDYYKAFTSTLDCYSTRASMYDSLLPNK